MKYNRWTVLQDGIRRSNSIYCYCRCDCGKEGYVQRANLIKGQSKSCGCLQAELARQRRLKHNEYAVDTINKIVIGKATNTGNEFIVDLEDFAKIKDLSWYESSAGYMTHRENGKLLQIHRIVTDCPEDKVVDHINHNKLDNRKQNLRVCLVKENNRNRKKTPVGITKIKRGNNDYYIVQLMGKYIGCSKDYDKAKEMRDKVMGEQYEDWKWKTE